jgi:hypothetical protein
MSSETFPSDEERQQSDVAGKRHSTVIPYKQRLDANLNWALIEGSRYFEGKGSVRYSLWKMSRRFDELGIAYAVADVMALYYHGYRRFTEDVAILVTKASRKQIQRQSVELGLLPPFERSRHLCDAETGVKIEFHTTGTFPGDGKPKPVAFPDPQDAAEERGGLKVLRLDRLIELKLASGMSAPHRMRDLVDVQELIHAAHLPRELVTQLDPSVRDKFLELWELANHPPTGPDADFPAE